MINLTIAMLLFVLGVPLLIKSIKLFTTPWEDMYSDFRNTSDYGVKAFNRQLRFKRVLCVGLCIACLGGAFYLSL